MWAYIIHNPDWTLRPRSSNIEDRRTKWPNWFRQTDFWKDKYIDQKCYLATTNFATAKHFYKTCTGRDLTKLQKKVIKKMVDKERTITKKK